MNVSRSKNALLYRHIRRGLQSGDYAPGQRIDAALLAEEFKTSSTPVRFALYRLVGEGLISDHARNGLQVPLPNEVVLHDLYDWMQRLLLMACDLSAAQTAKKNGKRVLFPIDTDVVKQTWQLFDAIADGSGHRSLHQAVKQANDRLAPVRRAKQMLFKDNVEELAELTRHWLKRDIPALRSALLDYHLRRKQRVPHIVALLDENHDQQQ